MCAVPCVSVYMPVFLIYYSLLGCGRTCYLKHYYQLWSLVMRLLIVGTGWSCGYTANPHSEHAPIILSVILTTQLFLYLLNSGASGRPIR